MPPFLFELNRTALVLFPSPETLHSTRSGRIAQVTVSTAGDRCVRELDVVPLPDREHDVARGATRTASSVHRGNLSAFTAQRACAR
jgi:hypothetical protein